ncbi:MAG: 3-dehydroquinate synthase [Candidatus Latescibacteria bacterium]|nr:3-dehydroquinate synthase [Candidatus Latescibacterota bacterium]
MKTVRIKLGDGRAYEDLVGHDVLSEAGTQCRALGLQERCALVYDQALHDTALPRVRDSLTTAGFECVTIAYDRGEAGKRLESVEAIIGHMIEAGLDRGTWVAALGGGVVGDIGGFVAASYLRGVAVVQMPTTIASQVDASLGGKTGVNHVLGKNLIGAFHQPRLVLSDTSTLRHLPEAERIAGLAEVVKHSVIRDEELFEFLEDNIEQVVSMAIGDEELDWLIARNASIKAAVVSADEREGGLRAILNYGHTIGHAIEAATNYQTYRHGEAVILGMIGAGRIASQLGVWSQEHEDRQHALLRRLGIPAGVGAIDDAQILARTKTDKKWRDGKLRFILPRRIGDAYVADDIEEEAVRAGIAHVQSLDRLAAS